MAGVVLNDIVRKDTANDIREPADKTAVERIRRTVVGVAEKP